MELNNIIKQHTNATKGNVFVDVMIIRRIAKEFVRHQTKTAKQSFLAGYRKGYTERSEIEYNEAIAANWQEAFEVENGIPTNIEIIEPSDDDNLLDNND